MHNINEKLYNGIKEITPDVFDDIKKRCINLDTDLDNYEVSSFNYRYILALACMIIAVVMIIPKFNKSKFLEESINECDVRSADIDEAVAQCSYMISENIKEYLDEDLNNAEYIIEEVNYLYELDIEDNTYNYVADINNEIILNCDNLDESKLDIANSRVIETRYILNVKDEIYEYNFDQNEEFISKNKLDRSYTAGKED